MSILRHKILKDALRPTVAMWLCGVCACSSASSRSSASNDTEPVAVTKAALLPRWDYEFGTRCEGSFQNNWQPPWNNYGMCSNFNNGIDSSANDYVVWYYNLVGAQPDLELTSRGCWTCGGIDSVDFTLIQTHGSYNSTQGVYYMWDQNVVATTDQMRLGDANSGQGASALATYSCYTLYTGDGQFATRWHSAFAGGLKLLMGAYDLVYDQNDQKGTEFSGRIEGNQLIDFSWNEAVWYADNTNHPISAATGANETDCWNRHAATMSNLYWLNKIQDGSIGWYCWSTWSG